MDFKQLLEELQTAHQNLSIHEGKEKRVIKEEAEMLRQMAKPLFQFATTRKIGNEFALLIYVFPRHNKEWISHEVYYTSSGQITYQVFDEDKYLGYVPDANIVDGFVVSSVEKFLLNVPFEYIYEFFEERIEVLYEYSEETITRTKERESFLRDFKNKFN